MNHYKKYNIAFFGTPDYSVPTLKKLLELPEINVKLVITQPDQAAGRGKKICFSPIKQVALDKNLNLYQAEKLKQAVEETSALFKSLQIDAAIVIAYGQILPQAILDLCQGKFLNLHASLLPKYRGAAPIQRALMNQEQKTGVCLMQMDAGLDTGPVFSKIECDILPTDNFKNLHDRLAQLSAQLCEKDLLNILSNQLIPEAQSDLGASYANKISNQECQIDWLQNYLKVHAKIKALDPSPGAFTYLENNRLKIYETKLAPKLDLKTGELMQKNQQLFVGCKDGALEILKLQLQGKQKLSTFEFLKGRKINYNQILG